MTSLVSLTTNRGGLHKVAATSQCCGGLMSWQSHGGLHEVAPSYGFKPSVSIETWFQC